MDLKNSNTQKIAIAALAFLIVVYFWYARVYSSYDSQINQKAQQFETITTNLRNVEMKAKSLDALKVEYTQLLDRYQDIEALLPEVKQVPSLLVQMHTASSITGTKIVRVQPMPIRSQDFYNIASFELEMIGTYHDFGKFTSYVANFPFIANVDGFALEAVEPPRQTRQEEDEDKPKEIGKKQETMSATFVLSTYFVKESERIQELEL